MKQMMQSVINSTNGSFIIGIAGIIFLYSIQRITETKYQFTMSSKDGESISLKPATVDNTEKSETTEDKKGEVQ